MCFLSCVVVIPSFRNEKSANLLRTVLIRERLNHYGTMAQRGLSSTFSRKFFNSNNITGLVKTSQHIHSGVTKRGTVDIVFERDGVQYDLCNVRSYYLFFRRVFRPLIDCNFVFSSVCSAPDSGTLRRWAANRTAKTRPTRRTCRQRPVWNWSYSACTSDRSTCLPARVSWWGTSGQGPDRIEHRSSRCVYSNYDNNAAAIPRKRNYNNS